MLSLRVIRCGHWPAALCLLALCSITSLGRAEVGALPLEYSADASCPDRAAFLDLLALKLSEAKAEAGSLPLTRLSLDLTRGESEFSGRLAFERADGSSYTREVNGASCAEVSNALAFVLALALGAKDPSTALRSEAAPPAPPAPEPALPAVPARKREHTPQRRSPPAPPTRWTGSVGVLLGSRAGLAPRWALLESAFVEARQARANGISWTLRAAFVNATSTAHSTATGSTDFRWWAGRLEACPARLGLLSTLALVPCAGMHLGRLQAAGQPSGERGTARSSSRVWLDAVFLLRLEFAATRWLSVQAQGEGLMPLSRYEFAFDAPDTPIYQNPRAAAGAFVGLAARFP